MKGLISIFVSRPVTAIMILAALIMAAIFSLFSLSVNRLPEFSIPRVTVETVYSGMAAEELRSMVTIPIEDGLSPVKGLERMRSVSRDNRSVISLDFRWGTDPMAASVLVREAIDAIYPALPEGVRKPTVTSGDSGAEAHAVIAVSSHNGNNEFARKLAEYEIQARLRRIDGVGSVVLSGGEVNEEKLLLDTARLSALGLSPSDFINLLAQETADISAGNAREGNMELVVVSSGKPDSVSSLSQTILPVNGGSIRVEDTGEMVYASAKQESIFVYNGKEAAALEVYHRPGADPLRLSREIKKTVNEAASAFSRDAKIELAAESSSSLISGITGLLISAALGALAVTAVLLFFIRRLKYSLLAALSIPISIAAGVCVLSITGKSLNGMSLGGLAMGIGLVSDISVIILDLLHRAFEKYTVKPKPDEIACKVSSIAGSSAASTLTTALVFIPVIMLPGQLGSLFGDIAIALVASVTAGWLYAQFFLPSLYLLFWGSSASLRLKIDPKYTVNTDGSLVIKYASFLSSVLRKSNKIFITAVLLSVLGFLTLILQPVVFINPDNAEEVWVSVIFPPGTMLHAAEKSGIDTSSLISGLPSVKTVYGRAGAEEEDVNRRADINYRKEELILRCVPEKGVKAEKALSDINAILKNNNDLLYSTLNPRIETYFPRDRTEALLGLSSQRTYVIKGNNRDELLERIDTAQDAFNSAAVTANLRPSGQRLELRLYPNREASAFLSMPAAQIAQTLFILNEGIVTTKLEIEGKPLDVRVMGKTSEEPLSRLEQIPLKTGNGKTVYLGSISKIERKEAEASLARLDRSDVIYADFSSGEKLPKAVSDLASRYSWFSGADESVFKRYFTSLIVYVFLVLILLYMAMGAQFESFLLPLILMMTIPFSLAGAGPALLLSGSKIDSGAILGLTALFGLVVNNSLILFEISDQKIRAGLCAQDAVYSGACERFQAILITMVTTVFALLPLIFSPLGNSQKSMAAAMLGGLTVSTLISLFAVPPVLIRYFKFSLRGENKIEAEK
ncbi:MAG: efflux RND transporter permease subunit [Treponema sp.]|nr:efflux RND transporter permease subunit [Treponema sp.]